MYAAIGFFIANIKAILLVADESLPMVARLLIRFVYLLVPNLHYFQIAGDLEPKGTAVVGWDHFLLSPVYCAIYILIFLLLAIRSFRGREVAG